MPLIGPAEDPESGSLMEPAGAARLDAELLFQGVELGAELVNLGFEARDTRLGVAVHTVRGPRGRRLRAGSRRAGAWRP